MNQNIMNKMWGQTQITRGDDALIDLQPTQPHNQKQKKKKDGYETKVERSDITKQSHNAKKKKLKERIYAYT